MTTRLLMLVMFASGLARPLVGQADTVRAPAGTPVVYRSDTLFHIQTRLGPFSPAERARAVSDRLARVAGDPLLSRDSVHALNEDGATAIAVGDVILTTVTEADAVAAGLSRDSLAAEHLAAITRAIRGHSVWAIIKTLLLGLLWAVIATAVLVLAIKLLNRLFPKLYALLERWRSTRIPTLRIQRLVLLSSSRMTDLLLVAAKVLRVGLVVVLLFWYVPLLFSFFPWTQGVADSLFAYILAPLREAGNAVVSYIPNVFYIGVILAFGYYLQRFIKLFFDGLERGTLQIPGFYDEWAQPTFKIVRFLILAFTIVLIFPYLPGSDSTAFKGVSVFVGVLLSFGSAGAIGNVVAGVVMTYMRPFKLGDRVRIADTEGDVIERTLLVTRVRTPKDVEITIPNALVLGSHIINYSAAALDGGVILHTDVTIGYDIPWRQVHELLLAAATETDGLLSDPEPFVLQTALGDFAVSYELNAYSEAPNRMAAIYSALHQHIQDQFQRAGVQIMSPHYENDPPSPKLPHPYTPNPKAAPAS
jgi:small-conductance mechanosensitive channel